MDDSSSQDDNDIEDETNSGENDVEYAEFSMAHLMPGQASTTQSGAAPVAPITKQKTSVHDPNTLDEEIMLLSLFDDSTNSTVLQETNSNHSGKWKAKSMFLN